jgi:tetratricopeptide (TPR) repeat protein
MGVVYRAHDPRLDRRVAVKVLQPELFTAQTAERFRREAQLHARVTHPNVIPIHTAGESDGLSFYVMDYVEGETLAQRLARGRMRPKAVRALGRSLLGAVSAVHAEKIIHRDIKPGNVFVGPRVLLADFGIARADGGEALTQDGQAVGTRGYMPREQENGSATPASDLYAASALLYEATTGRRWQLTAHPERANWSGVPRRLRQVLLRGLADAPDQRWPSATSFREALGEPALEGRLALYGVGLLTIGVIVGYIVKAVLRTPPASRPPVDFAVVPFIGAADTSSAGREVARYSSSLLEWYPAWSIRPAATTFAWWDSMPPAQRSTNAPAALGARLYVEGEIVARAGESVLNLAIRDSTGKLLQLLDVPGSAGDPFAWGRAAADSLVRRTYPGQLDDYRRVARLSSTSVPAYKEFFRGQEAFRKDNWVGAEAHYQRALDLDPGFAHAAWELALVRWWRRDSTAVDVLRQMYATSRDELPGLQRLLTEAQLEPDPERRLALLAQAVRQYPDNGDALLLFGNELFTRGPLVGIPADSGVRMFEATSKRELFATAFVHAALGHIRLGQREAADHDLKSLGTPSDSADAEARLRGKLLGFAYDERFVPWRARVKELFLGWWPDSSFLAGIRQYARFGNFFDIPRAQLVLGRTLVRESRDGATRATGHEAQGLASMLLGRPAAALAQLDSAAALLATPEAELQRAQWRMLMAPLGLGAPPNSEVEAARGRLATLAEEASGSRAAWTLAVAGIHNGDSSEIAHWTTRVAGDTGASDARDLHRLLLALSAGKRGALDSARTLAMPLLRYNARGVGADPFARALLHLELGSWLARVGDSRAAERVWLWTEAWDVRGWAEREAQAGEVDVAVGALARLRRGRLALEQGDSAVACKHLQRVRELWAQAEPALAPSRALADSLADGCH